MKIFYITLLLPLLFAGNLAAQRAERMSEEDREKIEAAFIAHITNRLSLNSKQAQEFWPVYNEFREKREAIEQEERNLRKALKTEEPADAEKVLQQMLSLREQELDLQKHYLNKEFKKMLSAEQRLQLLRAEEEFKRMLLRRLRESRRH